MSPLLLALLACSSPKPPEEPAVPTPTAAPTPRPKAGPNVLVVTLDTIRADHVGAWGYARPTTPNLDALATRGVRFARAISPRGATWPALTSVWTSVPPVIHGVRRNVQAMRTEATTMAEVLGPKGYTAAAFLTNHTATGWEGFPTVVDIADEPEDARAVDQAAEWLADAKGPFLAWVHLSSPHDPYVRHEGSPSFSDPAYAGPVNDEQDPLVRGMLLRPPFTDADRAEIVARYDGEIAYMDAQLGRLLAALDKAGHADDTLVVVAGDHGEELGQHPPYLFHFASPYDSVLHVPLVMAQPGVIAAGGAPTVTTSLLDVAPTVLDLLGVDRPAAWMGRSMVPAVAGERMAERDVYAEVEDKILVVYHGSTVYLSNPDGYAPKLAPPQQVQNAGLGRDVPINRYPIPGEALWDLRADPEQQHPSVSPDGLARGRQRVEAFKAATGWPGKYEGPAVAVPPATRAMLESMGYLAPGDP